MNEKGNGGQTKKWIFKIFFCRMDPKMVPPVETSPIYGHLKNIQTIEGYDVEDILVRTRGC